MKDFLKDVPKLEDLPKVIYKGEEVSIVLDGGDNEQCLILSAPNSFTWWAYKKYIEPIPCTKPIK